MLLTGALTDLQGTSALEWTLRDDRQLRYWLHLDDVHDGWIPTSLRKYDAPSDAYTTEFQIHGMDCMIHSRARETRR